MHQNGRDTHVRQCRVFGPRARIYMCLGEFGSDFARMSLAPPALAVYTPVSGGGSRGRRRRRARIPTRDVGPAGAASATTSVSTQRRPRVDRRARVCSGDAREVPRQARLSTSKPLWSSTTPTAAKADRACASAAATPRPSRQLRWTPQKYSELRVRPVEAAAPAFFSFPTLPPPLDAVPERGRARVLALPEPRPGRPRAPVQVVVVRPQLLRRLAY